jgi:putative endopeptidase
MNKGINLNFLNPSINPADDFYAFVNGGWMESVEIPEDRSSWGSFHELSKETDQKILSILENELAIPGQASNIAARLFESGMDIAHIEKAKLEAVDPYLTFVAQLKSAEDLPPLSGKLLKAELGGFIQLSVHPDLGNSQIYSAYLEPGGLGLPEREYYLDQSEKSDHIREQYHKYVAKILKAASRERGHNVEELASQIMALEKTLAENMMTKEDRRDIGKLYNPITVDALERKI